MDCWEGSSPMKTWVGEHSRRKLVTEQGATLCFPVPARLSSHTHVHTCAHTPTHPHTHTLTTWPFPDYPGPLCDTIQMAARTLHPDASLFNGGVWANSLRQEWPPCWGGKKKAFVAAAEQMRGERFGLLLSGPNNVIKSANITKADSFKCITLFVTTAL